MSPYFIAERARSVYPLSLSNVQTQHGVLIPSKLKQMTMSEEFHFQFFTNQYSFGR